MLRPIQTPLMIMAMWDYVRTSGDVGYLNANWGAVRKAWDFMGKHEDGEGIYSNSEGTGVGRELAARNA